MIQSRKKAIIITVLILIAFSFGTILTKLTYSNVRPFTFAYLSLLIGIIAMNVYTFLIRKERIPTEVMTKKVWAYTLQIAFFNFILGNLSMIALDYMPASTNAYLSNFIGFITMGLSCIILKELPGIWQLIGAAIAFAGIRVFFPQTPLPSEWVGILFIFIAITGIAYTNNIARKLALETQNKISNNIISTLAITIGGSIAILIFVMIDGFPPRTMTAHDWFAILYTGLVGKALGLTIWNLILRTLRSYEASILGASSVIWTTILAVIILHETVSTHQIIGIVMMLLGLMLVQVRTSAVPPMKRKNL